MDPDDRKQALKGIWMALEANQTLTCLHVLEQHAQHAAGALSRLTPAQLGELLSPGELADAQRFAAGFARAVHPVLHEMQRLGLYRPTRSPVPPTGPGAPEHGGT